MNEHRTKNEEVDLGQPCQQPPMRSLAILHPPTPIPGSITLSVKIKYNALFFFKFLEHSFLRSLFGFLIPCFQPLFKSCLPNGAILNTYCNPPIPLTL